MTAKKTMKRGTGLAATARDASVTPETIRARTHVPGATVATVEARAGFETVGPGLSVPRRAIIRFTRTPVDVVMDVALVGDHYEIVRLELTPHQGGKITGSELRRIAVATLLR